MRVRRWGSERYRLLLASSSVAALLAGGSAPAWAACSNYANTTAPGCTNAVTITGIAINNSTVTSGISNTGTINPNGIALTNGSTVNGQISSTGTLGGGISIDSTSKIANSGIDLGIGGSFTGGIHNAGTISSTGPSGAILIFGGPTFGGGITNSGTISASAVIGFGVLVQSVPTFTGDISNSGTIAAASGIVLQGVSTFTGNISNSGTLTNGISIRSSTVNGQISSTGKLTGGISIDNASRINSAASAIFIGTGNFSGGIHNAGLVSGSIALQNTTSFGGGITNTGAVSGNGPAISLNTVGTFTGGISNSGTVGSPNTGIQINFVSSFTGNVSNSGTITAGGNGILTSDISTFTGDISNSGRITVNGFGFNINFGSTFAGRISNSGTITAGATAISVVGTQTFTGGITNSGTLSSGSNRRGLVVNSITNFAGGILNSGRLTAGETGIFVGAVETFTGGISNAGTISTTADLTGILVTNVTSFAGGVSNSGTITGGSIAIKVGSISTFAGGISNSGAITAPVGIEVDPGVAFAPGSAIVNSGIITGTGGTAIDVSGASSPVTIDQTAGLVSGAIRLSSNADVVNISGGTINGNILGAGTADTINFALGSGTFTYNFAFTGINQVNIASGTVILNGANSASLVDVNGGTLAGSGSIDPTIVTIHSGATFAPGTPGVPGTSMSIIGNLAFQSAAIYQVYLNPGAANRANVSGTASLGGTVNAVFAGGNYVSKQYTILTATGGLGGTTFSGLTNTNLPASASDSLSYDANDVYLNLTAGFTQFTGLNINQQNVANGLTNFFNANGGIPAQFFGLAPGSLTQLDGEAATGAERAVFQLDDQFLQLMLDPFVNGRGFAPGSPAGGALGFAPDRQEALPPDVALAYASILRKAPASSFEQRWSAWGAAYGGSSTASGNAAVVGSTNTTASTYGIAGGMDYHVSPDTVVGFALAGAGTNWGLANALGTGRSDALQLGAYGITWFGPAYLAGAIDFSNHWFSTNRSALGAPLTADFVAQGYGARLESGYRIGVLPMLGATPYAAVQFLDINTPSYSESDPTGSGFGLSYASMNATDVRTELGSRFDAPTLFYGKPLVLYGRLAWAHDFVSNPALNAVFQTLPGSGFTVFGAPIAHDSALTTAGAQLFLSAKWSLIAKFDGEFASGSQSYSGSGTLRYTW